MRRDEIARLGAALAEPVRRFVRDARVRVALVVNASGQIMAQQGFAGSYQVANVAALAAAANASSRALAALVGEPRWRHMHHEGGNRQLFLAPFSTPAGEIVLVAIFDDESSIGVVELFFNALADEVRALPEFAYAAPSADARSFERDLEAGLGQMLVPGA